MHGTSLRFSPDVHVLICGPADIEPPGPIDQRDLGVSDTQIGFLQGLSFALFYTLMGLPLGRMADSCNRRNLIAASIAVWSFFYGAMRCHKELFHTLHGACWCRVAEAGLSPAAYS